MASNCRECGRITPTNSDLFCPSHQLTTLRALDRAGYLEPLEYTTISGKVRLSDRPFLTLPDFPFLDPEDGELDLIPEN